MANLFPRHRSLIFLRAILLGWFFAIGSSCIASHSATREEVDFHRRSNPACLASIGRAESLGPGVARFYARDVDPRALPASLAIEREPVVVGRPSQQWPVFPLFVRAEGRHAVRVHIEPGTDLYGTGEIAGPLRRNGQVTQAWNTDSYDYNRGSRQLYQSHPWVLAVRRDGTSFGVLADTTWRCRIDLTDGIEFSTKQRSFPVIIITGKTPQQVLIRLSRLIGTLPMPPKWALGYHQCRYSYYPDSRVREIADGFRRRHIPCDVIWLDIDYMHGFRIFTFNPTHFPDPESTNNYLHRHGFKSVWMIDPGVKKEPGYFVYDSGCAGDHWVLTAEGEAYTGNVWPGPCVFPDFTRPQTRAWWAGLYLDYVARGIDGVWNDMNEPAIFRPGQPTGTMPEDSVHRGGGGLPAGPHAQYHNVYGMLMVMATRAGVRAARPDRRPFILTRANYLGGQRYAATWTGDNVADWEHLEDSVPMILNLGLSGQPFCGPDIGGFIGDGNAELFARWFGVGAFFPFCRGHTGKGNRDKEPWSFGPDVEAVCRTALERRYRLMPYLYTLLHESSRNGLPVMRPVFFADPADPALRGEDDAFLLGTNLLVIPRLTRDGDARSALPRGIWRPFTLVSEDPSGDVNQPELRIRGGAIIPLGKVIQYTEEESLDPLTLLVCLDADGTARGTLYEDAGDGFADLKGAYRQTTYAAERRGNRIHVYVAGREGDLPLPHRTIQVDWITPEGVIHASFVEREDLDRIDSE